MPGSIQDMTENGINCTGVIKPSPSSCASLGVPNQSFSWTVPRTGRYTFVLWGAGGTGDAYSGDGTATVHFSGGSGSMSVKKNVLLSAGQVLTGFVGTGRVKFGATDTYINFPTGQVRAGGANNNSPGSASGGDYNVSGSPGAYATSGVYSSIALPGNSQLGPGGAAGGTGMAGAGAPGYGIMRGGAGGTPDRGTTPSSFGAQPGGGGSQMYPFPDQQVATGGDGMILVFLV